MNPQEQQGQPPQDQENSQYPRIPQYPSEYLGFIPVSPTGQPNSTAIEEENLLTQHLTARVLSPKDFKSLPGPAKLTTVSASATAQRLTAIFGPHGIGWGVEYGAGDVSYWMDGDKANAVIKHAIFWFVWPNHEGVNTRYEVHVSGYDKSADKMNGLRYALEGARTTCISNGAKSLLFQAHLWDK